MLFRLADRNSTASKELYETFIFSFARYFALSLAVSAQEMTGLQFNGVEIATTEAEVIQKLGKPSSRKRSAGNECQGSLLKLRRPGLMIKIETFGRNICRCCGNRHFPETICFGHQNRRKRE